MSYKREGRPFEHYNSQAGLFAQATKEMYLLLDIFGGNSVRNIFLGIGDLYVTVFGGRNRRLGNLLGQGYTYDEATKTITLDCEEITEEMVTVIKVVKSDGNTLHLDFNGEIRIFEK